MGFLRTLEVRVPVSPRHAILMTWLDEGDWLEPLQGTRDQAANINAFTVANAERQWFYQPGTRVPPRATGRLVSLSAQVMRDYDAAIAERSLRRRMVAEILAKRSGEHLSNGPVEVVHLSTQTT